MAVMVMEYGKWNMEYGIWNNKYYIIIIIIIIINYGIKILN